MELLKLFDLTTDLNSKRGDKPFIYTRFCDVCGVNAPDISLKYKKDGKPGAICKPCYEKLFKNNSK